MIDAVVENSAFASRVGTVTTEGIVAKTDMQLANQRDGA